MKICPTCRKTYQDDGLNFCLEDGSILTMAPTEAPPTVMMQSPPRTNPNTGSVQQPPTIKTSWDQQQQYSMQPKPKSSKTWLWVVGLLGLGLLLCGGGIVGFIGFAIYNADTNNSNVVSSTNNSNNRFPGNASPSPGTAPVSDGRTKLESIDLSGWVQTNSLYGNTEFTGDELIMGAKKKGYYYVLVAQDEYSTDDANTRLTVRNIDNADTKMGYGLVFHSNPTPLEQGYAFLIDSKKKRYRIVRHVPQDEPVVVKWTDSKAINDGTQENILEVRDKDGSVDLYINDQKVTTIRNVYGYRNG
ncbi:MAG: hypothetical protein ACRD6X_18765, partial [Pyrinomonadaceae bacterium]